MGRPRLPPEIRFRLPADLYDVVADRAEAHGVSVDEYVRDKFVVAVSLWRDASLSPQTSAVGGLQRETVTPRWKASKK